MHNKFANKLQENRKEFLDSSPYILDVKKTSSISKKKEYTSPTSIWTNSIYSYNKNYIKNIPTVDNIVNKLVKSFFTINALYNNIGGKKLKLIQRKFKNLSLNRIFVSKSEIKHSNNKVIITVYLFNKKKKSLLLSLTKLYKSLYKGFTYKNRPWKKNNNFENLSNRFNLESNIFKSNKILNTKSIINTSNKSKYYNLSTNIYNNSKKYEYIKNIIVNRYGFTPLSINLNKKNSIYKNIKAPQPNNVAFISYNKKISYYNKLNNLTKYNIYKFIASSDLSSTNTITNNFMKIINKFFVHINQYKLYKTNNLVTKDIFANLPYIKSNSANLVTKINYSIKKLKSVNKLFVLYNQFKSETKSNNVLHYSSIMNVYTNILLFNTYKLLRKSYRESYNFNVDSLDLKNTDYSFNFTLNKKKIISKSRKILNANNLLQKDTSMQVLVKKLNRIDRFFRKYKNLLIVKNGEKLFSKDQFIGTQFINNYKINFMNDILEKELLYINYLKLLSYNNIVFKSWFLLPLKNLISKIYNKKIILNLVNLKYIHLNSDILSQGVDIRLKNFRRNKLIDVLKKAIKLVPISKVNVYACDEHSSMYKYIHSHYKKFNSLKLGIFKELGFKEQDNSISVYKSEVNIIEDNNTYIPCTIRRLNHIQTSTINFIKFKSVFGARLEAAGRLTKRSTASRALFKFRYKGTLKNNPTINNSLSATIIKNHQISNLQYTKISSKTRNGSFGLKGWINSN